MAALLSPRPASAAYSRATAAPTPLMDQVFSTPPCDAEPGFAELLASRPWLRVAPDVGLMLDGVPLRLLARDYGTPLWVYSDAVLAARYRALETALRGARLSFRIHFALKANSTLTILRRLAALGAGADVVSLGEYEAARRSGFGAEDIVFSGVGKTDEEIEAALVGGVGQINVESAEELRRVAAIAARVGRRAPVALRVNPDVDAGSHAKITTGKADNKFGIPFDQIAPLYAEAASSPSLQPVGLAVHIGSQILDLAPYRRAYSRVAELLRSLRAQGLPLERIDAGGGFGIRYRNEIAPLSAAYAAVLREAFGSFGLPILLEPGRGLVGPAGLLLCRVVVQKRGAARRFVVLDAGMNDLLRPALYDAWHGIVPVDPARLKAAATPADVVGPICETADTFARDRHLPDFVAGDLVAILDAGAYGAVMSSAYNLRPRAAEVLIVGGLPR
ncbi:MAG: diaminopimelate decarboxylase, partial [Elioraea sp.]|nr:diaminopimelate decarboxylase [Elioraea sp.]